MKRTPKDIAISLAKKTVIMLFAAASLMLLLISLAVTASAKDLGVRGEVFDINEQPIFEMLRERISEASEDGTIDRINEEFRDRVRKSLERPVPVEGIVKAVDYSSWSYDPTVYAEEDYKDANGRVVVAKGHSFNPLQFTAMRGSLYFIDSDIKGQLDWAFARLDEQGGLGKIILVKGAPLEVMRERGRRVYFDQKSALSNQFEIKVVPTVVSQDGNVLKVEEIPLDGDREVRHGQTRAE